LIREIEAKMILAPMKRKSYRGSVKKLAPLSTPKVMIRGTKAQCTAQRKEAEAPTTSISKPKTFFISARSYGKEDLKKIHHYRDPSD